MSDLTLVCCWIGDKQYAFNDTDVRQIARVEKMRSDETADGRVGVLDVGGQSAPVFRLGDILSRGQQASHGSGNHIAVTGSGSEVTGWLVDHIARTSVPKDAHSAALPSVIGPVASSWFEALVWIGTTSVLLMSPRYLNPLVKRRARFDPAKAAAAAGAKKKGGDPAESVVLLFSTPALPSAGSSRFALSGKRIAAITQPIPAIAVPGSAPHVTGVSWWRNAVVPVIDFRGPGDHDDTEERRRCVIAQCGARLGNTLVAFPVDSEIAMHRPGADDRQVTGTSCPPFISGMFEIGGEVVGLLDLDALLAPVRSDAAEARDVAMSA